MWLLSVNTCRSWEVCVWWEVFVSQLITGNTHRQIPNSKDLICITLSICTPAPSFQQHPWGQTVTAWECLLPDLLAVRTGLFSMLQPLIYSQKSLVLKRQLDTEKLNQFSPVGSCVSGEGMLVRSCALQVSWAGKGPRKESAFN